MKNRSIMEAILMLLLASSATAQEAVAPDSVIVLGSVVNRLSGVPEPYCTVHFLSGNDTAATTLCDAEGFFAFDPLPAGTYGLSVSLRGMNLYQADLVLNSNAELNIGVITDSIRLVNLREVAIVALRHLLGEQLISTTHDIRLWNMLYRKGGGDHNAAVSISPDMTPECDEIDVQNGVLRLLLPVGIPGKAYKYYLSDFGLNESSENSTMKNELLREGRILDTKRRVPTGTDSTRNEKK